MNTPTSSDILRQRRARAWLDDNTSDWGPTLEPTGETKLYAYVYGFGDVPIYADNIIQLCIEGCELNGDSFRP